MPIVAALPIIAAGASAIGAVKGAFSSSGKGPEQGGGMPERAVDAGMANKQLGQNQAALGQQQAFLNALQAQNGVGNQSNVYNQLSGVASGQGPNPAQAMLRNATGQNAAQTAALMGSGRGVSQNAGMIARQAGQAGANLQQQSVGQGAAMQANQSLGALGQMGGIAGQQVGNQMAATQAMTAAQQQQYQQMLDQIKSQNQTAAGMQENINTGNTQLGLQGNKQLADMAGGVMNAGGAALGALGSPKTTAQPQGGTPGMTLNQYQSQNTGTKPTQTMNSGQGLAAGGEVPGQGPRSAFGQHLKMSRGGRVPAKVSPGEIYLPPAKARAVAKGKASPMSGERIKGKAKFKGDSYSNDTVHKNLESGGVVVPRSKSQDYEQAAAFVRSVMSRGKRR